MKKDLNFKSSMIALLLFLCAAPAFALPAFEETVRSYHQSEGVLLDRHGAVIDAVRVDPNGRRLDWIALTDVSPALIRNVLYCEDREFYGHHGVSWRSFGSALFRNLLSGEKRGASTITMQVASKLDERIRPRRGNRSVKQKWDQIRLAREMEKTWKKNEILEAYLNLVTFRGELQGIAAASRGLFGKDASGLTEAEAMILAALIRSPNAPTEEAAQRACTLAESRQGGAAGAASCRDIRAAAATLPTGGYAAEPRAHLAPHAAGMLLDGGKKRASSTLDGHLQRVALESLQQQLIALKSHHVNDGAVLVADNRTGDILAYVGNAAPYTSARHVDGIRAKRQAGSTIKPFIYEYVLEKRIITAATLLDDSPLLIPTPAGIYEPHNYDNDFKGPVDVRTALASSLNVPAVRVLMMVGPDEAVGRLGRLGFGGLRDGAHYGMSLALGSVDVSLYELVNAYRTLANGGRWSDLRLQSGGNGPLSKRVMAPEAAFIISDILSDREARSLTFDFENPLATRFWTAVKTGTSKDMRDNWCIGYSDRYTVGVWVGNFSGESMRHVSGIAGAAPVWLEIMNDLHRGKPGRAPVRPSGVASAETLRLNERREYFISGTEPAHITAEDSKGISDMPVRILYPAPGTIIALDPDIPEKNHRVYFEATRPGRWRLNGRPLESGALIAWRPRSGRYSLSLTDTEGKIVDSVDFEVRGSIPSPPEFELKKHEETIGKEFGCR